MATVHIHIVAEPDLGALMQLARAIAAIEATRVQIHDRRRLL